LEVKMKKKLMIVGIFLVLILPGIIGSASSAGVGDWFLLTDDPNYQGVPDVTYNPAWDQFLVIWEDTRDTGYSSVYAQFVNSNGTLAGGNFPIAIGEPAPSWHILGLPKLAYNSAADRYLVVGLDESYGAFEIYGQQVNANGSLFGSKIAIPHTATLWESYPDIAYNSLANQFLVVYRAYIDDGTDYPPHNIYGAFVNANGTFAGPAFPISPTWYAHSGRYPVVAYGATNNHYLVVWDKDDIIYGRFVNVGGLMEGDEFAITALDYYEQPETDIAYAPTLNEFLVVWVHNSDIYGRLVRADQTFVGPEFQIASAGAWDDLRSPAVSFDPSSNQFLVAWSNSDSWGSIDARQVGANGEMPEPSFEVAGVTKRDYYNPEIAFGSEANQFLLVWDRKRCLNSECDSYETNVYGAFYQAIAHYDYELYLPLVSKN
jgi:hypothetical protein